VRRSRHSKSSRRTNVDRTAGRSITHGRANDLRADHRR
jgi:hypothetical protein